MLQHFQMKIPLSMYLQKNNLIIEREVHITLSHRSVWEQSMQKTDITQLQANFFFFPHQMKYKKLERHKQKASKSVNG